MSTTSSPGHFICALDDLPDPGTYEFSVGAGEWPVRGFVLRDQGELHAYLNRCPMPSNRIGLDDPY